MILLTVLLVVNYIYFIIGHSKGLSVDPRERIYNSSQTRMVRLLVR